MKNFVLKMIFVLCVSQASAQWSQIPVNTTGTMVEQGVTYEYRCSSSDLISLNDKNNYWSHHPRVKPLPYPVDQMYSTANMRLFCKQMVQKVFPLVFSQPRLTEIMQHRPSNYLSYYFKCDDNGYIKEISFTIEKESTLTLTEIANLEKYIKQHIKIEFLYESKYKGTDYIPVPFSSGISGYFKF
jgi:hypothetical protein